MIKKCPHTAKKSHPWFFTHCTKLVKKLVKLPFSWISRNEKNGKNCQFLPFFYHFCDFGDFSHGEPGPTRSEPVVWGKMTFFFQGCFLRPTWPRAFSHPPNRVVQAWKQQAPCGISRGESEKVQKNVFSLGHLSTWGAKSKKGNSECHIFTV